MLLNRGQGEGGDVLSERGYRRLTAQPIETGWGGYGYGQMIRQRAGFPHIGHGGGMPGYNAHLLADVDNGLGIVLLSTHRYSRDLYWTLMGLWRAVRLGQAESLKSLMVPPADPTRIESAADYAGTYRMGDKSLTFVAEGERLVLRYNGEQILLEARGDDTFYAHHPDFYTFLLQFQRADAGSDGEPGGVIE